MRTDVTKIIAGAESVSLLRNYIPQGRENAVHQNELALRMGCSAAAVKYAVRKARRAGEPIMSGTEGYWYTNNRCEMQAFTKSMTKQAISRFASIKEIRRELSTDVEQMSLDELIEKGGEVHGTQKPADLS